VQGITLGREGDGDLWGGGGEKKTLEEGRLGEKSKRGGLQMRRQEGRKHEPKKVKVSIQDSIKKVEIDMG